MHLVVFLNATYVLGLQKNERAIERTNERQKRKQNKQDQQSAFGDGGDGEGDAEGALLKIIPSGCDLRVFSFARRHFFIVQFGPNFNVEPLSPFEPHFSFSVLLSSQNLSVHK